MLAAPLSAGFGRELECGPCLSLAPTHCVMATVATYRAPAHTIDNGRGPRPSRIPVRARPVDVCLDSPTLPDLASTARKPGFQLLHSLPTELLELALHLLDLVDLLRLCAVDRSVRSARYDVVSV